MVEDAKLKDQIVAVGQTALSARYQRVNPQIDRSDVVETGQVKQTLWWNVPASQRNWTRWCNKLSVEYGENYAAPALNAGRKVQVAQVLGSLRFTDYMYD